MAPSYPPHDILIENKDCTNGETFTVSTGITATADTVVCIYLDYWFYGNQMDTSKSAINNIICIGKNAQSWNDYCTRLYTGQNNNIAQMLLVAFNDGDQEYKNTGSIMRHNKVVIRMDYTTGTADFYMNGQTIARDFGAWGTGGQSAALGEIIISNAEGSHRSYSFYNEISIIKANNWTDAMLERYTKVEKYDLTQIVYEKVSAAKRIYLDIANGAEADKVDEAAIAAANNERTGSTFDSTIDWDGTSWATATGAATILDMNYHLTTVNTGNAEADYWQADEPAILWRTGCVSDGAAVNDETLGKQIASYLDGLTYLSAVTNSLGTSNIWRKYQIRIAKALAKNQTPDDTSDDHYIVVVGIVCFLQDWPEDADENTRLLLHGDEIADSSNWKRLITNNNATINKDITKFGNGSLYFNGTSARLLFPQDTLTFNKSTGFTIEWWEYCANSDAATRFCSSYTTDSSFGGLFIGFSGNKVYAGDAASKWNLINGTNMLSVTVNEWVHWAFVWDGENLTSYRNGTQFAQVALTTAPYQNNSFNMAIGDQRLNDHKYFNGYIEEFRISDVVRYTSDFTPQNEPFEV